MASRLTLPDAAIAGAVALSHDAPQHGPRPLPLFLSMVLKEAGGSPQRLDRVMAGLRAYQSAPRHPRLPPPPCAAREGRACLIDYGTGDGTPVVFVPSLINPPDVLDLMPGNSLLRWLADQPGLRPMLVDWGWPAPGERDLDIAGHVTTLLLPLLDRLPYPPVLVGYCLGGTMAIAAATLRPVAGLALIATPWRFSGFPDAARRDLWDLWSASGAAADIAGLLPIEVMQSAFWRLDPARTIAKFERFAALDPDSAEARQFVVLEDWANGGAPLTYGAAREAFEGFFGDDLPGSGAWQIGGTAIDPATLGCPVLNIVSTSDRIVPSASAAAVGERRALAAGHVGMIVGGRARAQLWEPLAQWVSAVTNQC